MLSDNWFSCFPFYWLMNVLSELLLRDLKVVMLLFWAFKIFFVVIMRWSNRDDDVVGQISSGFVDLLNFCWLCNNLQADVGKLWLVSAKKNFGWFPFTFGLCVNLKLVNHINLWIYGEGGVCLIFPVVVSSVFIRSLSVNVKLSSYV